MIFMHVYIGAFLSIKLDTRFPLVYFGLWGFLKKGISRPYNTIAVSLQGVSILNTLPLNDSHFWERANNFG